MDTATEEMRPQIDCPTCDGRGDFPEQATSPYLAPGEIECVVCNGNGTIDAPEEEETEHECAGCAAMIPIDDRACSSCELEQHEIGMHRVFGR